MLISFVTFPPNSARKIKNLQYIFSAFSANQSAHFWTNQLHVAFIQSSCFSNKTLPSRRFKNQRWPSSTYPAVNPLLTPRKINKHGTYKSPIFVQRKMIWTTPPWLSSWWFNQPIWKICSSNWIISPRIRGENNTYLKPPPSITLAIYTFIGSTTNVIILVTIVRVGDETIT